MRLVMTRAAMVVIAFLAAMPTAWSDDGPRTGYFKKSITPLELLGERGAEAVSALFAADEELTWQLSVPQTYDPAKPAGVIVFIGPRNWGGGKKAWVPVLEERNIIWIGLVGGGYKKPMNERMLRAILAPTVLLQDYKIDADRLYVSGLSGGAHVAAILATTKPETFKGAFFMGGALFWGDKMPPKIEIVRQNRFVFLVGFLDKAKMTVQRVAASYNAAGVVNTKLIMVPNLAQSMPGASYFDEALDYLDSR